MRCIDNVEVGRRLEQLNDKQKLQNKQSVNNLNISLELGISNSRYSRLKNGHSTISVDELRKFCTVYGCPAQYILFGYVPRARSEIFKKIRHLDERGKRRCLKMLACSIDRDTVPKAQKAHPMYKLFMDGLLEQIPDGTVNVLPYVLAYEKKRLGWGRDKMIKQLGLTCFKWNTIMRGISPEEVSILLRVEEVFGYDIHFLVSNELPGNGYFDALLKKQPERRERILGLFDEIQKFGEHEYLVELQGREK